MYIFLGKGVFVCLFCCCCCFWWVFVVVVVIFFSPSLKFQQNLTNYVCAVFAYCVQLIEMPAVYFILNL